MSERERVCVCVCVSERARARVHMCVRVCVRARMHVHMHMCFACVHTSLHAIVNVHLQNTQHKFCPAPSSIRVKSSQNTFLFTHGAIKRIAFAHLRGAETDKLVSAHTQVRAMGESRKERLPRRTVSSRITIYDIH